MTREGRNQAESLAEVKVIQSCFLFYSGLKNRKSVVLLDSQMRGALFSEFTVLHHGDNEVCKTTTTTAANVATTYECNQMNEVQKQKDRIVRKFLDLNLLSTAQGSLRTNHTVSHILLYQFDLQGIKFQVKRQFTVLDTDQSQRQVTTVSSKIDAQP